MLFNSISFLIFLPVVFILYWGLFKKSLKLQNIFLLLASYLFYGWWDYRFLALIAASTLVDFFIGRFLQKTENEIHRKMLLGLSLVFNLGLLGFFKYYNFFIESWIDSWANLGVEMQVSSLNIILPVGISFYTFQTLSYTIDVYRRKIEPTSNIINFSVFVAFFPQLVAGPIERAKHLLPQFSKKRIFNEERAISGIHLILWGLFKKIVIADSCAVYVNAIFNDYENMNSASLLLGAFYFAFQIYGDFSGYSDIAIGTGRLFGFDLMRNFNSPYFSRNIAEFWRRWHISLSTWFRDYLYIPLGGSRGSKWQQVRNVFIIFLVSGFWHGANWTFVIWGGLHALFFLPLLLGDQNRKHLNQVAENNLLPSFRELLQMMLTFGLTSFAWIFFRADTLVDAVNFIKRIFTDHRFELQFLSIERYNVELLLIIGSFVLLEWFHRHLEHPFSGTFKWVKIIAIILMLLTLGVYSDQQEFIYFQF
jgi:D-alanyl-lipoteichoic acid acyltransferase DltB (MBOAT superfamily)